MNVTRFPVAAVVASDHGGVDALLAEFAARLRGRGVRVRGLLQQCRDGAEQKDETVLVDIEDGSSYPLFQKLGPGSVSCRLDSSGVAAASVVLRRASEQGADLVIVNRFGALEATGSGLAGDMLALMSAGIPVLTVVVELYRADWRRFTGGVAVDLPPELEALQAWFDQMRTERAGL